jgi:glutamyl-tRNA reductase
MHNQFKALSLSHNNAPVNIRELVSLDELACKSLLQKIKDFSPASEAMVLSTCNRTEIYYSADKDLSQDLIKLIGIEKKIANIEEYVPYFDSYNTNEEAVRHLFYVSMGLHAKVVGDIQISNQVKKAYQWSADENMAGPFLHRLLHTIFFTNKRVVQETSYRDGAASVSYATVELIEELAANFISPKILILGLGEIGADVCRNLTNKGLENIYITNRTFAKAEALAEECNFKAIPFENAHKAIHDADLVISSIAADSPFVHKELLLAQEILGFKFFIDLSVPRSVSPEADEIPGIMVYNIDQIQSKTSAALERRIASVPAVKNIIEESILDFNDWNKEMMVSPTINKLKNALEQIRQDEIARHLKGLNKDEADKIEKITKGIMQKIIKLPVLQLKAACKRGEADTLIDVLNDLFDLEKQPSSEPTKPQ